MPQSTQSTDRQSAEDPQEKKLDKEHHLPFSKTHIRRYSLSLYLSSFLPFCPQFILFPLQSEATFCPSDPWLGVFVAWCPGQVCTGHVGSQSSASPSLTAEAQFPSFLILFRVFFINISTRKEFKCILRVKIAFNAFNTYWSVFFTNKNIF